MNLSSAHCKLLQRVWKELRDEKLKQAAEQRQQCAADCSLYSLQLEASTSEEAAAGRGAEPGQQMLYQIVLGFVDNAVWELRSREFRARLRAHCRHFGRQMAAVFRGAADLDQTLSWDLLGLSQLLEGMLSTSRSLDSAGGGRALQQHQQQQLRRNATKLIIWQLFLENLSTMVFEAFCWSVARDFTPTPLPTIYESDPKLCFPQRLPLRHKLPFLKRLLAKFVSLRCSRAVTHSYWSDSDPRGNMRDRTMGQERDLRSCSPSSISPRAQTDSLQSADFGTLLPEETPLLLPPQFRAVDHAHRLFVAEPPVRRQREEATVPAKCKYGSAGIRSSVCPVPHILCRRMLRREFFPFCFHPILWGVGPDGGQVQQG